MSGSNQDRSMEWEWMEMEDSSPVEEFPYKLFPATWSPRSPGTIDFYNYNWQVQFEIPENNSAIHGKIMLIELGKDKESMLRHYVYGEGTATTFSLKPPIFILVEFEIPENSSAIPSRITYVECQDHQESILTTFVGTLRTLRLEQIIKIYQVGDTKVVVIRRGGRLSAFADDSRDIYKLLAQRISAITVAFERHINIKKSSKDRIAIGEFSIDVNGVLSISSVKQVPIAELLREHIYLDQASSSQSLVRFTVRDKLHRNGKRSAEQADIPSALFICDLKILVPYSGSTLKSLFADGLLDWSSSYYTSLSQSFVANTLAYKQHKNIKRSPQGGIRPIEITSDVTVLTKQATISDGLPVNNTECSSLNQTSSHQSLVAFTVADKQHKNIGRSPDEGEIQRIELISDVNVLEPSISSTKQVDIADYLPVDYTECSSLNQTSSHQSLASVMVADKQHKNIERSPDEGEIPPIELISDVNVLEPSISSTKQVDIADYLPVDYTECSSLNQTSSHQCLASIMVADKQHKNIERSPDEGEIPPIELISDVNVLEPSISSTKQVDIADYLPVDNTECSPLNQTSSHQSLVAITVADIQHKNTEGSPNESGIPPTQIISDVNVPVDNTECNYINQTISNKSLVAITVANKQHKNIDRLLDEGGIPPTQLISDVNVPESNSLNQTKQVAIADYLPVNNTECSSLNQTSLNKSLVAITVADKQNKNIDRSLDYGGIPPTQLISDVNVPEHNSLNQTSSSLSLDTFTVADEQHKSKTGGRPRKLITDINVLLPYSGFTQQAAAEQLNIGISTLKRSCRILDIKEWSELKNRNVAAEAGTYNQISLATRPSKKSKMRNARPVIVKAKYKGDTTKVNLFSSSKKVDLDEQLARKLNIELGSFKIKRMDEENEEILVSTDSDFEDCITDSESQGNKTIRLLVEQITI